MKTHQNDISDIPLVSVVMISYNSERFITDAIKGVVGQKTSFPYELIISDDSSTDSTPDIIRLWQKKYPYVIRFFQNKVNLGIQSNYLEAFRHCRGKYMAMCDADDYWFNRHKLSRQIDYMENHPECSITFHRVVNYYLDNNTKSLSNGGQKTDTTINDLSKANYITNLSVMYRLDGIELNKLPDFLTKEKLLDYAMHMLVASRGSIHYFRKPMGVYRQYSKGEWSKKGNLERLDMALRVRERLIEYFNSNPSIVSNLRNASAKIIAAMLRSSNDHKVRSAILHRAKAIGIDERDITFGNEDPGRRLMRRIISRTRGCVSKIIPIPQSKI